MSFAAFWLPGPTASLDCISRTLADGTELRYPQLTGAQVSEYCSTLTIAGARASHLSLAERISAIDAAAHLLMDPADQFFTQAMRLIPQTTGYSPEMTRYVLEHISRDWLRPALEKLVASEFGDAAALDDFASEDGRRTAALGPDLAAHVFAGNVPGVAINSLVRALLVKATSFGKTAGDEPVLPVLFARALHHVQPLLAQTLAISYWPGGSEQAEAALFNAADTVIVYGGADTVESVTRRIRPETRLLVHGPKISFGIVNARSLTQEELVDTAAEVALAASVFDQQGCVSPHLVYVTGPKDLTDQFARLIAAALGRLESELPRGRITPAEAAAIQHARAQAEFRAIGGAEVAIHAGPDASFTVVSDSDPSFEPSCLNRFLYVKRLPDLASLHTLLEPYGAFLQSLAIAGFTADDRSDLRALVRTLGVTRITSFAALPWPPVHWHHDGRGPLRELVRWLDLET